MIVTLKRLFLLLVATAAGSGSTFVLNVVLAKHFKPAEYGSLASAISIATFASVFYGFGITQYWLAVYGKEGWGAQRWVQASLKLILITAVLINVVYLAWASMGPHSEMEREILFMLTLFSAGQLGIDMVASRLQLEERYTKLAMWQVIPQALRLFLTLSILYILGKNDIRYVALTFGLVGLSTLIIGGLSARKLAEGKIRLVGHGSRPRRQTESVQTLRELWDELYPFGTAAALGFIYSQGNTILVRYLADEASAGMYAAAQILMNAVMLLPVIIFHKYLIPKYHRWAYSDTAKLRRIYKLSDKLMALAGGLFSIVVVVFSDRIISIIFGDLYASSSSIMQILALAIPVYFMSYSSAAVLATKDNMRRKIKYMLVSAALNVALNCVLVPSYGAKGAAIAILLSYMALLAMYKYSIKYHVFAVSVTPLVERSEN